MHLFGGRLGRPLVLVLAIVVRWNVGPITVTGKEMEALGASSSYAWLCVGIVRGKGNRSILCVSDTVWTVEVAKAKGKHSMSGVRLW